MIRKLLLIILGCLLVGGITVFLWWVNVKEQGTEIPREAFIPANSAVVVHANPTFRLSTKLTTMFDKEIQDFQGSLLARVLTSLKQKGLADTTMTTWAFRVEGKNVVRRLIILDCGNLFERGNIYPFVTALAGKDKSREKTYDDHKICVLQGQRKENVAVTVAGNRILLSDSELYIEDVIRQLQKGNDSPVHARFKEVNRYFSEMAGLNVFLNTGAFSDLLPLFIDKRIVSDKMDISTWFEWGGVDVDVNDDGVNFNGFLYYDAGLRSFPAVLKGQRPGEMQLDKVLPASSLSASALVLSDVNMYLESLDKFRFHAGQAEKNRKRKQEYARLFGNDFEKKWNELVGGEWAKGILSYEGEEKSEEGVIVLQVKVGSLATELIHEMLEQYARAAKKSVADFKGSFRLDNSKDVIYYHFPATDFVSVMWGDIFDGMAANYVLVEDNNVVFASSREAMRSFARDRARRLSLRDQEWFQKIREKLSRDGNWMYLSNIPSALSFYEDASVGVWKSYLKENREKLAEFPALGLQWSNEGDMLYSILFLSTDEVARKEAQLIWQTKLDAPLAIKPAIVKNHNTGGREVFVQDEKNTIYLIDDDGRVLWKLPIEGRINSEIFQVDMYKNGKLQYLFSTPSHLYLIDRNGNYLPRYPLSLPSSSKQGMSLCDYEGNRDYRIFIPGDDRRIYLYDLTGNQVQGWNIPRCDNDIVSRVSHFRVSGKDYIVYAGQHRLYILDRRGKERVRVSELLNLPDTTYLYLTRVSDKACIALNDVDGNFLLVDFTGKVTTVKPDKMEKGGWLNVDDVNGDGVDEFVYSRGDCLRVYSNQGKLLEEHEWKGARLDYPYVYRFSARDIRIGGVDRARENLFLTDGKELSKGFPIAGMTPFSIAFGGTGTSGFYLFAGDHGEHLLKYQVAR